MSAMKAKEASVRAAVEPMTFEALCNAFNCTAGERNELVWHLAAYRFRRTVEALTAPLAALSALREKP